jgi:hypothetical protein
MRRILASAMLALTLAGGIMTFVGSFTSVEAHPHSPFSGCNEGPNEPPECDCPNGITC